jgi:hypothetical protein
VEVVRWWRPGLLEREEFGAVNDDDTKLQSL